MNVHATGMNVNPVPARALSLRGASIRRLALFSVALLAAALALIATTPASAVVLVSTIGQTADSEGGIVWGDRWHAQAFTTGSDSAGYTLTSIEARTNQPDSDPTELRAQLWSDNNGIPGTKLADLTVPGTITASASSPANITFTAPASTSLDANTTYHFTISAVGARGSNTNATYFQIVNTASVNEDSGAATGWSIANRSRYGDGASDNPPSSWEDFSKTRMIRINGESKSATPVTSTNANLDDLVVKRGTDVITLTPSFAASTLNYRAEEVTSDVSSVIFTPTAVESGATIQVGKSGSLTTVASGADSGAISLDVGDNAVLVVVTAADTTTTRTYTVTITRAEKPTVSISVSPTEVPEGGFVVVTARLSSALGTNEDIPISWAIGDDPNFEFLGTAEGSDIVEENITIAITAGATTGTGTYNTAQDDDNEDDSFTVTLQTALLSPSQPGSNAAVGSPDAVLVTIIDDEPNTITLSADKLFVNPGGTVQVAATLNGAVNTYQASVRLNDGLEDNPSRREDLGYAIEPTTLNFGAGATSGPTSTITVSEDAVPGTTISLTASGAIGNAVYALSTKTPLEITIAAERTEQLHQTALPEVARAVAGLTTAAISTRVGQVLNGSDGGASASLGGQSTLAGVLTTHAPALANENRSLRDLLNGSRFVLPLNANLNGGGGGGGSMSLWGSGEYRDLSSEDDDLEIDGTLYGAQVGVDAKLRGGLLAGLALSWSEGDLEYEDNTGGGSAGDYEVDMQVIHPYLGGSSGLVDWWATLGYGNGEVEITPEIGESSSNDVSLRTMGMGGSGLLWSGGENATEVRFKGELTRTELEVDASERVAALEVDATLIRVAMEASRTRSLAGGGTLSPSFSLGARHDGGDGNTGTGAEIGGGVRYANAESGVSASASAHALLGRSDYSEWGIQGTVRLSSGADGQGLSFEMRPGYGGDGNGNTGQIWSNGLRGDSAAHDSSANASGRLEMRLGYGLSPTDERNGLLTPWGGLALKNDGNRYQMGLDWASGDSFTLRLHGERREHENADADHIVLLKGEARF